MTVWSGLSQVVVFRDDKLQAQLPEQRWPADRVTGSLISLLITGKLQDVIWSSTSYIGCITSIKKNKRKLSTNFKEDSLKVVKSHSFKILQKKVNLFNFIIRQISPIKLFNRTNLKNSKIIHKEMLYQFKNFEKKSYLASWSVSLQNFCNGWKCTFSK